MDYILDDFEIPEPSASFQDRLRYLMKLSRTNQAGFARQAGTDPAYLSRVLSGKQEPGQSFINRLVVNLGVSKEWLTTGPTPAFRRPAGPNRATP